MSVFKRAEWKSGLTYRQTCENCRTEITYMDDRLDFRPWYADGFIYCPSCQTPLRHSERYAIDGPAKPVAVDLTTGSAVHADTAFCTQCGTKFQDSDKFCRKCGTKR